MTTKVFESAELMVCKCLQTFYLGQFKEKMTKIFSVKLEVGQAFNLL